jgi:hypothetical protein
MPALIKQTRFVNFSICTMQLAYFKPIGVCTIKHIMAVIKHQCQIGTEPRTVKLFKVTIIYRSKLVSLSLTVQHRDLIFVSKAGAPLHDSTQRFGHRYWARKEVTNTLDYYGN